jgi:hypothetical protein
MTKKDFMLAWVLASRSAGENISQIEMHLEHAEQMWEYLQKQYEGEDE